MRVPRTVVASVVTAVAVLGLGGCSGSDSSTGRAPTTPPTTAATAPTVTPSSTPSSAPAVDPLDWTTGFHHGQPIDLRRVGDGFVGLETQAVAGLSEQGRIRWRWTPPTADDMGSFLAGDVAVAEPDIKHGDHEVVALDARTGKELWTQPSNGYSTGDDRRVFVTTCAGRIDDPTGDCSMTAYDARTGAVDWVTPFGTYTENTSLVGGRLLVQAFRDGHSSSFMLVDPTTGAILDEDVDPVSPDYFVYEIGDDRLAAVTDDATVKDGCRPSVALFDLAGHQLWRRTVPVKPETYHPRECEEVFPYEAGAAVALSTGGSTLLLVDDNGTVRWRATTARLVDAAAHGVLVTTRDDGSSTGLDLRTGKVAWHSSLVTGEWRTADGYLVTNAECPDASGDCTFLVDPSDGAVTLTVHGVPESFVEPRQPGGRVGLQTRIDATSGYRSRYGYVTLPPLTHQ